LKKELFWRVEGRKKWLFHGEEGVLPGGGRQLPWRGGDRETRREGEGESIASLFGGEKKGDVPGETAEEGGS